MNFESEVRDRLAATANRFVPNPEVLADAEQRAERRLRARRRTRGMAVAAVLILVVAVTTQVLRQPATEPPMIGPRPTDSPLPSELSPTPNDSTTEAEGRGDGGGAWASIDEGPLGPRTDAAAVWTGEELFVWGGTGEGQLPQADGAMYDPATDRWDRIAAAPGDGRSRATAVWTGSRVLVFGGNRPGGNFTGEPTVQVTAYDPATDSWELFDDPPMEPRTNASVTWTGDELIVWGGASRHGQETEGGSTRVEMFADGAAFDPGSGQWRQLASSPLAPRGDHAAVWDGERLIVLGGGSSDTVEGEWSWLDEHHDAAAYDPEADSWQVLDSPDDIGPLVGAHWTGEGIVYWTGHTDPDTPGNWLAPGGTWDPETGRFEEMAAPPFQQRRDYAVTAWADELDAMITWGGMVGEGGNRHFDDGAVYSPATDAWMGLPEARLGARNGHVGAWTGEQLIIWGGATDGSGDGGPPTGYQPRADGASWRP